MTRILIVDDDVGFRKMLTQLLVSEGYTVAEASDGLQAVGLYHENPVDLVITDLFMPEKEGMTLLRELKMQYPECKVIVMSGGGKQGRLQILKVASILGADHVLAKPFEPQNLLPIVGDLLGGENQTVE